MRRALAALALAALAGCGSTVQVSALPKGARIEIEAIALGREGDA